MSLPYTRDQRVWSGKDAGDTVTLDAEFARCLSIVVETVTTGFSGTLDLKGAVDPDGTADNLKYIEVGATGAQTPAKTQITFTTETARRRFLITEYCPKRQLVMTRSAGSISCCVAGHENIDRIFLG